MIMQQVFFWTQIFEQHKKIYQHAGKCGDQQNLKDIIDAVCFQLQRESHITVLMCIWHKHQSKNQVLVNYCVYSPTYLMLNQKHQNIAIIKFWRSYEDHWYWPIIMQKCLLLNTNVWTTSKRYINMQVIVTTNKT